MLLLPDKRFLNIAGITAERLKDEGVKGLVLDIDYTLASRRSPLPNSEIRTFIRSLQDAGVRLYILSNNHHNRVSRFAEALGLPYQANGCKPLPFAFRRAVRAMGLAKQEAVAVGDQIFTDVCGAHLAGLRAWMVAPYGGEDGSLFYRFRRSVEGPFIRAVTPEDELPPQKRT